MTSSNNPQGEGMEGWARPVDDPAREKQLSAQLARYMDLQAFTAVRIGKERAEKMKARREIATKRARAAIRFFMKPENLARLNAQAAPTPEQNP